jgi:hypothetical protein
VRQEQTNRQGCNHLYSPAEENGDLHFVCVFVCACVKGGGGKMATVI